MGLFSRSFDKPGPGIDPDAPQKRSFFRFFDIFFRKFWHFVKVNLLYILALIPTFIIVYVLMFFTAARMFDSVIAGADSEGVGSLLLLSALVFSNLFISVWGMGPATAGITYIMRNFAREEHAWLWSDFKDAVKTNFKQSIAVFAIDIVMFLLFCTAVLVYSQMGGFMGVLRYVMYMMIGIYSMMHFYIYPMMVTFDLKLKDLYRNAFLFTFGALPSNLFVLIIQAFIHLILPLCIVMMGGQYFVIMLLVLFLLELLVLQAFSAFLVNFNAYPKMKKYMIDSMGQRESADDGKAVESVTVDMPENVDYDKVLEDERLKKWDDGKSDENIGE